MITNLAELLEALRNTEAKVLKRQDIKHGPTIGDMYEGLTRDILRRAIPPELGVQVVEGFVEGLDGEKSNQADVLVVHGNGKKIPYTEKYIWPIQNVLAVFEVKKNLYKDELKDSFEKMQRVMALHKAFADRGGYENKVVAFPHKNFARLTGFYPKIGEVEDLPMPLPLMHYSLITEQLGPVRVVLGYEGYASELGLRQGIIDYLQTLGSGPNRGFLSYPSLVICRGFSVVKSNGLPYYYPVEDYQAWWHIMMSSSENPIRILLEQLWTKIGVELEIELPMDDSLEQEQFAPFLRQKYTQIEQNGIVQSGFMLDWYDRMPNQQPETSPSWEPEDADVVEAVILGRAASYGSVSIDDIGLQTLAERNGTSAEKAINGMVHKRILGWLDGTRRIARPIANSYATVFTPSGKTAISDQAPLLGLWTSNELARNRESDGGGSDKNDTAGDN